jgi:hypothetical protein
VLKHLQRHCYHIANLAVTALSCHTANVAHAAALCTQQGLNVGDMIAIYYRLLLQLDQPQQLQVLQLTSIFAGQLQCPRPLYTLLVSDEISYIVVQDTVGALDVVLHVVAGAFPGEQPVGARHHIDAVCSWDSAYPNELAEAWTVLQQRASTTEQDSYWFTVSHLTLALIWSNDDCCKLVKHMPM